MSAPGFWDKPETAQEVGRKRARVEKRIASGEEILNKDSELDVLLELQREGEPSMPKSTRSWRSSRRRSPPSR